MTKAINALLGTVWGGCFAVGLVDGLDHVAAHHAIGGLDSFLMGVGAGGIGYMIGSAAR